MPDLRTVPKGDSNPGSHDCESASNVEGMQSPRSCVGVHTPCAAACVRKMS